jgi:DNA-binding response OmpR family regulator
MQSHPAHDAATRQARGPEEIEVAYQRDRGHELGELRPGPVSVLVVGSLDRVRFVADALRDHSCDVDLLENVKLVVDECEHQWPEVVVLDVAINGRTEALDALEWLRHSAGLPTVVMTQPDDVDARLRALALQADDTVAPTDPREIVTRVALLARRGRGRHTVAQSLGDMVIYRDGRSVARRGHEISLTHRESEVLDVLVERPGRVVSKDELLQRVWKSNGRSVNAVEAQISGLRRKLHETGPPVIHTAHGEGYVFRPSVLVNAVSRAHMISERERLVREREEAVAVRARLLRQMETELGRRGEAHHDD